MYSPEQVDAFARGELVPATFESSLVLTDDQWDAYQKAKETGYLLIPAGKERVIPGIVWTMWREATGQIGGAVLLGDGWDPVHQEDDPQTAAVILYVSFDNEKQQTRMWEQLHAECVKRFGGSRAWLGPDPTIAGFCCGRVPNEQAEDLMQSFLRIARSS